MKRARTSECERAIGDGGVDEWSSTDDGFSLVEVVMTVVLISLVIIPLLTATFMSVRASSTAREVAEIETVLRNAADRVTRAPLPSCDFKIYVEAAALANDWEASRVRASYQYYVPGASALASDPGSWTAPGPTAMSACPHGVRTPRLIQLVTITVTSESGSITRSIQVVKSDV